MKKIVLIAVALIVIAGTVVGGYLRSRKTIQTEISTQSISRGVVVHAVGATGTLESVVTVDVGTQVNGIIKELYADFNSIVRKGQLIAKIDPATIEAKIQQDNAQLASAVANRQRLEVSLDDARNKLRRAEDLARRNLVTVQELETTQVNVKTAEAQIKAQDAAIAQVKATLHQDEVNLGYTNIYAPIDGIVINRKVDIGQTVVSNNTATSMFQIAQDLTQMQLKASIDESDVGLLRPGQVATFRVDAYPEQEFTGSVSQVRLQPVVTQNVVTYVTIIKVPNPELQLKPGMTANVKIEVARRENVVRVPVAALRFRALPEHFELLNIQAPPEVTKRSPSSPAVAPVVATEVSRARSTRDSIARGGATTIDALFGPLAFAETAGRVWIYSKDATTGAHSLKALGVRTGINDGTWAELLDTGGLNESMTLVTGIDSGRAAPAQAGANPLMPNRMGGHFDGGHGGPH